MAVVVVRAAIGPEASTAVDALLVLVFDDPDRRFCASADPSGCDASLFDRELEPDPDRLSFAFFSVRRFCVPLAWPPPAALAAAASSSESLSSGLRQFGSTVDVCSSALGATPNDATEEGRRTYVPSSSRMRFPRVDLRRRTSPLVPVCVASAAIVAAVRWLEDRWPADFERESLLALASPSLSSCACMLTMPLRAPDASLLLRWRRVCALVPAAWLVSGFLSTPWLSWLSMLTMFFRIPDALSSLLRWYAASFLDTRFRGAGSPLSAALWSNMLTMPARGLSPLPFAFPPRPAIPYPAAAASPAFAL